MRIVVDSSALIAMLLAEPDAEELGKAMGQSEPVLSAGSLIETLRVVNRRMGSSARARVWRLLAEFDIEICPVDEEQVHLAEEGTARFGIGRATDVPVLNFGDLFAYALARHLDAPLLFKGNDFARTDIKPALAA